MMITVTVNNRLGGDFRSLRATVMGHEWKTDSLAVNQNVTGVMKFLIPGKRLLQPYWLERGCTTELCGRPAESERARANGNPGSVFTLTAADRVWTFSRPVRFKYTDPVKGERFEPVQIIQPVPINASPSLVIFRNADNNQVKPIRFSIQAKIPVKGKIELEAYNNERDFAMPSIDSGMSRMETRAVSV